ncbi:MAG: N-acetylmuramoyl-L-alanine amidase [Paracoccaceae bacterium]|nr:N-acetylmuramoyl-L-alanine amidase [Paracoccaceae bacterium]MDG1736782.1 N-acetylmuramoyl-L-alanine amidase [Paracoccaceae bacterium]MDG2258331.1 N-acetylmuramoyl-L-alanine amidase [Paracoccaceae bacterium]
MKKIVLIIAAMLIGATASLAQDLSGLARFDVSKSSIENKWRGVMLTLGLSQGVPWRVFTLDEPRRLVADFREVDWGDATGLSLDQTDRAGDVRFGQFQPGWSRMVVDLKAPLKLDAAEMRIDEDTGLAELQVDLALVSSAEFSETSGQPETPGWWLPPAAEVAKARMRQSGQEELTVVIDPGHGGIDPGAEHGDQTEKVLMLAMARELKDHLVRTNRMRVVLTRDDDSFVPLEMRVAIARHAEADLFISLHADALGQGQAHGATVYTLSDTASDKASAALAERHDRDDLLAGVDLRGQDDTIANVLMDLAWLENQPRSQAVANAIVLALDQAGTPLHKVPRRSAGFSVLKAPDIPSVLLEVGFLSSTKDRERLLDPEWRANTAAAITSAILSWSQTDAAIGDLVRQ